MPIPETLLHFDKQAVPELLGDSRELVVELLHMVIHELQRACTAMEKHLNDKNQHAIATEAHKLHGTALTAGLPVLSGLAVQLQRLQVFDEIRAKELLAQIIPEITVVTEEIKAFLAED